MPWINWGFECRSMPLLKVRSYPGEDFTRHNWKPIWNDYTYIKSLCCKIRDSVSKKKICHPVLHCIYCPALPLPLEASFTTTPLHYGPHVSVEVPLMSKETTTYGFRAGTRTVIRISPWNQNDTAAPVKRLKFLICVALINTHGTFGLWDRWFSSLLFFTVAIRNHTEV